VTVARPTYVNLSDLMGATGVKSSAYVRSKLERALEAGSSLAEDRLRRIFYPRAATRKFDWPDRNQGTSYRLWLGEHEFTSITSLTSGGTSLVDGTDFVLRPYEGPPYGSIELLVSSGASFGGGSTWQDDVIIVGTLGYDDVTTSAATTAEALDDSETGIDCGPCPEIAAGDLVTIDDERMLVTSVSLLDTGQDVGADLAADRTADTVAVTTGSAYSADELITIGAERMRILDIAGDSLIVTRAADGSTLAPHTTGASIYAPRTLSVTRGATGTTAATHLTSATVYKQMYPATLRALALAESLNSLEQEASAYARTIGSGEAERNASGAGIADIRRAAEVRMRRARGPWAV